MLNPSGLPGAPFSQFIPFSDSPLWSRQHNYYRQRGMAAWSEGKVPHYLTNNPSMARTYADIVLGYWRDLKSR